jgi:hypothetical protein
MGQKYAAYDSTGAIVAYYDSVDSPIHDGVTAIKITDAQWQACLAAQGTGRPYTVVNGALTAPSVKTAAELLAEAQAAQALVISNACAAAIVSSFPSLALGSSHTYPSKMTDQQNLDASVTDALCAKADPAWTASTAVEAGSICVSGRVPYLCVVGGTTGATEPVWPTSKDSLVNDGDAQWQLWTTAFWCEDAAGNWAWTEHTAAQIIQVGRDLKAQVLALQAKCATLTAKIAACTTIADVNAVVWA